MSQERLISASRGSDSLPSLVWRIGHILRKSVHFQADGKQDFIEQVYTPVNDTLYNIMNVHDQAIGVVIAQHKKESESREKEIRRLKLQNLKLEQQLANVQEAVKD